MTIRPSVTPTGVEPPQPVDVIALPRADVEQVERHMRWAVGLLGLLALIAAFGAWFVGSKLQTIAETLAVQRR